MVDPLHLRLLEALLFASAEPVGERQLAEALPDGVALRPLLNVLQQHYRERGVNLVGVGNSWAFRTAPDLGPLLGHHRTVERKLSRAALESLAIIAYHQPVTRAEIEEIRGVKIGKGTIDVLLEEGWIRPGHRRQTPGRPVTWGTTERFLDHFGLAGLDELPGVEELKAAGLLDTRPAIQAYGASPDSGSTDDDETDSE